MKCVLWVGVVRCLSDVWLVCVADFDEHGVLLPDPGGAAGAEARVRPAARLGAAAC